MKPKQSQIKFSSAPTPDSRHYAPHTPAPTQQSRPLLEDSRHSEQSAAQSKDSHFILPAPIHPARQNNPTQNSYKSPNITIDRLVLHLPNLSPAQARDLAQRVGTGLAAARRALGNTNFPSLPIELAPSIPTGDLPRLADAIVHALLTQMERS
jgi:hypothetical protein